MKKVLIILILLLMLSACVPGDRHHSAQKPAGFLWGIWHGWIAPISLILGIFHPSVRIYEVHNIGWLYDLGFYMAIIGGLGSLSLSRKKNRR